MPPVAVLYLVYAFVDLRPPAFANQLSDLDF